MYTLREWLKFAYPLIWQAWATASIGTEQFLATANSALNMIYNYQWYDWSWQHTKALFHLSSPDKTQWKLLTKYPVKKVDKFYSTRWQDVESCASACNIDCDIKDPELVCEMNCWDCIANCSNLEMVWILPNDQLCVWQYQIWGGNFFTELWWQQWKIIRASLKKWVDTLWLTYFRWVDHLKSFDDIIPLPDSYMTARAYFLAWYVVPLYWIMMQQQDLNYHSIARKELDSLKMGDNIRHDKVRFADDKYPTVTNTNVF